MGYPAKITSKGQVTIPKKIRGYLNSDIVEFFVINNHVELRPVKDVGAGLAAYRKKVKPMQEIRDMVWKEATDDSK